MVLTLEEVLDKESAKEESIPEKVRSLCPPKESIVYVLASEILDKVYSLGGSVDQDSRYDCAEWSVNIALDAQKRKEISILLENLPNQPKKNKLTAALATLIAFYSGDVGELRNSIYKLAKYKYSMA